MSDINYINDILEILQINNFSHNFVPFPFPDSNSCILKKVNDDGIMIMWDCGQNVGHRKELICIRNHKEKGNQSLYKIWSKICSCY